MIACAHCEDGVLWLGCRGEGDPYARPEECTECYAGNAKCCELNCSEHATHLWPEAGHQYPLCAEHYSRWQEAFNDA